MGSYNPNYDPNATPEDLDKYDREHELGKYAPAKASDPPKKRQNKELQSYKEQQARNSKRKPEELEWAREDRDMQKRREKAISQCNHIYDFYDNINNEWICRWCGTPKPD